MGGGGGLADTLTSLGFLGGSGGATEGFRPPQKLLPSFTVLSSILSLSIDGLLEDAELFELFCCLTGLRACLGAAVGTGLLDTAGLFETAGLLETAGFFGGGTGLEDGSTTGSAWFSTTGLSGV